MPAKKDADFVFFELTRSICPDCRKVIDAQVILRDNKVYMGKRCPECVIRELACLDFLHCRCPAAPKVCGLVEFSELVPRTTEPHDEALREMVRQVQAKLLGAEVLMGLKKIDLAGIDFTSAKQMASAALDVVQQGHLGYALIIAEKP